MTNSNSYVQSERDEDDELDELDMENDANGVIAKTSSIMGAASAGVETELSDKLDPIFLEFLAETCSDRESPSFCLSGTCAHLIDEMNDEQWTLLMRKEKRFIRL